MLSKSQPRVEGTVLIVYAVIYVTALFLWWHDTE